MLNRAICRRIASAQVSVRPAHEPEMGTRTAVPSSAGRPVVFAAAVASLLCLFCESADAQSPIKPRTAPSPAAERRIAVVPVRLHFDVQQPLLYEKAGRYEWVWVSEGVWEERFEGKPTVQIRVVSRLSEGERTGTVLFVDRAQLEFFLPDRTSVSKGIELRMIYRGNRKGAWQALAVPVVDEWGSINLANFDADNQWHAPAAAKAGPAPANVGGKQLGPQPPKPPENRLPAPPAEATRRGAEATIRNIFAADYASRSPNTLKALSKRLLKEVSDAKDQPTRFVLMNDAMTTAIRAGDYPLAAEAIAKMGAQFDVDSFALRVSALSTIAPTASGGDVVGFAEVLAREAVDRYQFDDAVKLVAIAKRAAVNAKGQASTDRAASLAKHVSREHAEYERVEPSIRLLHQNPNDPKLNLIVGTYFAFYRGDWERGLHLLSWSGDPLLAPLAKADRKSPQKAEEQEHLGELWADASAKLTDPAHVQRARERAVHWFRHAEVTLRGLDRARVEKKREAVEATDRRR